MERIKIMATKDLQRVQIEPGLHLKYRPQKLSEVIGQPHLTKALSVAIADNKIRQAYIFSGTRGCGKTSISRIIAMCLNCQIGMTSEPCGVCSSCKSIASGNSIDVFELDAATHNSVDNARQLSSDANNPPLGRFKIFILDEVHQFSISAQNALLKLFEEPPQRVIFILATTNPEKVLETIRSRCQQWSLRKLSPDTIFQQLKAIAVKESINTSDDILQILADNAAGGMRDALVALDKARAVTSVDEIYEQLGIVPPSKAIALLKAIASEETAQLLIQARELIQVFQPEKIIEALIILYRDLLIFREIGEGFGNISEVRSWSSDRIENSIDRLSEAERNLRLATNKELWLEITLLRLVRDRVTVKPTDVSKINFPAVLLNNSKYK